MYIKEINEKEMELHIAIPLTQTSGKTRIKQRSFTYEYGLPFAPRTNKIMQNCYIEWQIGYDVVIDDEKKMALTTKKDINFIGANGKHKTIYELSEYIYYFYQWGVLTKQDLLNVTQYLNNIPNKDLIEQLDKKDMNKLFIKLSEIFRNGVKNFLFVQNFVFFSLFHNLYYPTR
mgnify:CR=1 FL=1